MLGSKLGVLFGSAARRTRSVACYSGSPSFLTASPPPTSSTPPSQDKAKKGPGPQPQAPKRPSQGTKPQGQPRQAPPSAAAKAAPQSTATPGTGDQKKPGTWSSLLGDLKKANAAGQQRKPRDQQQGQTAQNKPRQDSSQGDTPAPRAPGQQQASGERRVYNNRAPQNRGPPRRGAPGVSKPAVAAAMTGAAGVAAVPGGAIPPGRLFGSKRDADEDDDDVRETDEIPPEIEPYLFDSPFFEEMTRKGQSMDYSDMDPADKFFADVWMESFKSSTHEVTYVMEKEGINRVRIPQPRATVDLLQTLIPDIHAIDHREDKEAMEVASAAWQALSKNVYFADEDKSYMCNQIARQAKYFLDESEKLSKSGAADAFLIFNPDFRRGWEGMDAEAQRLLFADFEGSSSTQVAVLGEDGEDVTDYSKAAEAVIDEDQL